jgi:alanine racemase
MAVIKADAYGHGITDAARALSAADSFAVAMPEEGILLRDNGVEHDISVLHGFTDADELELFHQYRLTPVIHRLQQVEILAATALAAPIPLWLKIDTGMHRLGVSLSEAGQALQTLTSLAWVEKVSLMTHYANAEHADNNLNNIQLSKFFKVVSSYGLAASMANSAALIQLPGSHFDVVRPGIMLYGSSPFHDRTAEQLGLQAVMQFESAVISVKWIPAGESIGYGSTYTCQHDTRIAIVAAGYGDGYPRHAKTGTPVWLHGHVCQLLGRVSMDSISVQIDDLDIRPGDRAVLWGKELSVDRVALHSDTIAYELLCQAGAASKRRLLESGVS